MISVIVPIYNGAATLSRCIDSILDQTFRDIEIICIDDVSTDDSVAVVERLAERDSRVRLVRHATNRGHGPTRNTGISAARGSYLFHIDPDDTIPPAALSTLHQLGESTGADLVRGTFCVVDQGVKGEPRALITRGGVEFGLTFATDRRLRRIPAGHWLCLYRSEVFKEVLYPEDVDFAYDMLFLTKAYMAARSVAVTPEVVYHYHHEPDSTMNSPISWRKVYGNLTWRVKAFELLSAAGWAEDARNRLLTGGHYVIDRFWLPMVRQLEISDIVRFFDHYRVTMSDLNVLPWARDTADEVRKVREAIMLRQHSRALRLLECRRHDADTSAIQPQVSVLCAPGVSQRAPFAAEPADIEVITVAHRLNLTSSITTGISLSRRGLGLEVERTEIEGLNFALWKSTGKWVCIAREEFSLRGFEQLLEVASQPSNDGVARWQGHVLFDRRQLERQSLRFDRNTTSDPVEELAERVARSLTSVASFKTAPWEPAI